ncbi:MAG: tetratricopeptide repeat protein, partial [Legionellales bacterium]|nr:tetratricopeptide repeat protein [Legionellales bacterium]
VDSKVAYTLSDLGEQFRTEGDYTQAAAYLKEALTMYSKLDGKEKEVVQVRNKLGLVYIKQSNFRLAESSLEEALKDAVENSPEQADAYYYLGLMHTAQQSYPKATAALDQALTIFQTLDNSGYVARMRYHLGLVYLAQNQNAPAEQSLKDALTALPTDSEDNDELAEALHHLGLARQALKNYSEALTSFQLALTEYHKLDEKQHQMGLTHYHIGTVYLAQNNYTNAIDSFDQALLVFGEDNEHVAVTEVRLSLGLAEQACDNLPNALEHWNIALTQYLTINDDLKYNSKIEELLKHIGLAYKAQGHINYAIASFERILELEDVANATVAATHHLMGKTYLAANAMEEAKESLNKALEIYQTLNLQTEITTVQRLLISIANQTTTPGDAHIVVPEVTRRYEADTAALNSSPNIGEQKDPLCCWGFFSSSWSFFSNPQTNSGLPAGVKTPLIPTVATGYGSESLG